MTFRTRFAPSPTGPLHLGHAYSALLAYDMAIAAKGEFLLRIEDIDLSRARPEWEAQIYDDLTWLGIKWPQPVMRQSDQLPRYRTTLETLWAQHAIFACNCTRRDISEAVAAPQEGAAPLLGPDGVIYPGTCHANCRTADQLDFPEGIALRVLMEKAVNDIKDTRQTLNFMETGTGPSGVTSVISFTAQEVINTIGDVVLARRDMGTSYHLSVVLDDAAQGITDVVRGQDLFEATKIHVVLQKLLGLPTPRYHHHRLIRDNNGTRLAKRDDARAISLYRAEGASPQDIRAMVGL